MDASADAMTTDAAAEASALPQGDRAMMQRDLTSAALCLGDGRFRVTVRWRDGGNPRPGRAVLPSDLGGAFWLDDHAEGGRGEVALHHRAIALGESGCLGSGIRRHRVG